jgi:uncharacterized delta-60 repeat protein
VKKQFASKKEKPGWVSLVITTLLFLLVCMPALSQNADSFDPNADSTNYAIVVQEDGRLLVGGDFHILASNICTYLGRVNLDGTLDHSFNASLNDDVYSLSIQPDGKILVGGNFTIIAGQLRNHFARLNSDGTLDVGFNPNISGTVFSSLVLENGQILVAGSFAIVGGTIHNHIVRLNLDGTVDASFIASASDVVYSMATQTNGQIVVGGMFTALDGMTRNHIGRLNMNGTLDSSFNASANNVVNALTIQTDGKIVLGGAFTSLGSQARSNIGRLNTDGSVDLVFNPSATGAVDTLFIQTDGAILVGGSFTNLGGKNLPNLGRVSAAGIADIAFNPAPNGPVMSLSMQGDGRIVVGGYFTTLGGQTRNNIARLNNTASPSDNLTFDGATIAWQRAGTDAEVWRTSFDAIINGTNVISLGDGQRTSNSWQLSGTALPPNTTILAHGFVTGGHANGSGWTVGASIGQPGISYQPANLTNNALSVASLSVQAYGTPPLAYQWYQGAVAMTDGNGVSGSQTPVLTINTVLGGNSGEYSIIVTNNYGSLVSQPATLTVVDPYILNSVAVTRYANIGDNIVQSVTVLGSMPFTYQWFKQGNSLPISTSSTLTLTNVQPADSGTYNVLVSNVYGATPGNTVRLEINEALADAFNPYTNSFFNGIAIQPNRQILLAGDLVGRVDDAGAIDSSFPVTFYGEGFCVAIQTNGQILIGGPFVSLDGITCSNIARLNCDGTVDTNFNPRADNSVLALAGQADGKWVVGGWFDSLGGQPHSYLGRINADGTVDSTFTNGTSSVIHSIAVQPDGKIIVVGDFLDLGGQPCQRIGRLNPDSSPDLTFQNAGTVSTNTGANAIVNCVVLQSDGKILVGGNFTALGGQSRSGVGRLNTDGTLDSSFDPVTGNGNSGVVINSLVLQTDGKILVGGEFGSLAGDQRGNLGRLNSDGTVDMTFNPILSETPYIPEVSSLALQDNGELLVAGVFDHLAGIAVSDLGRLTATYPATQELTFDGYTITWLRGGTSPEVWRTTFEYSTDGTNWASLGDGTRQEGGWQLNGVAVPVNSSLRARGFTVGGNDDSSTWYVESSLVVVSNLPPKIITSDGSLGFRSDRFGFTVAGLISQVVVIEASTNLTDWLPLATNKLDSGLLYFSDAGWTNCEKRFYRARLN